MVLYIGKLIKEASVTRLLEDRLCVIVRLIDPQMASRERLTRGEVELVLTHLDLTDAETLLLNPRFS